MKLAHPELPGNWLHRPLPLLVFIGLFVGSVYEAANYIIAGNLTGLAYVALVFVGCAVVVAMLIDWRNGLYFFLAWLLFEDLVRKVPGQ